MNPGTAIGLLAVVGLLWICLRAAERRGWIRLHGGHKGSAAIAFAAVEDMFAPSRTLPREIQEEQKRIGARVAGIPDVGDEPELLADDPSRRFAGRIVLPRPDSP